MEYENIRYDVIDHIARITMNRPQYRNAQSTPMLIEMDHAFEAANFDLDVRAIVLFGEGDHFSAGQNLSQWLGHGLEDSVGEREHREKYDKDTAEHDEKPVAQLNEVRH